MLESNLQINSNKKQTKQWFLKENIINSTTILQSKTDCFFNILEDNFENRMDPITSYIKLFKLKQDNNKWNDFINRFLELTKYYEHKSIEDEHSVSIIMFDTHILAFSTKRGKDYPVFYINNQYTLEHCLKEYFKTFIHKNDNINHWKNIKYLINISKLNDVVISDDYKIIW